MTDENQRGDSFNVKIGDVTDRSQIAVGKGIDQSQTEVSGPPLTEAERTQLHELFEELRKKIEQEAPPAEKQQALEHVKELEEAVVAKKPDVSKMENVKRWFGKNLPALAGSVVSLIVHPLVGKAVEVGGEVIATTFRKRFGLPEASSP
jgi:hypothetical protein